MCLLLFVSRLFVTMIGFENRNSDSLLIPVVHFRNFRTLFAALLGLLWLASSHIGERCCAQETPAKPAITPAGTETTGTETTETTGTETTGTETTGTETTGSADPAQSSPEVTPVTTTQVEPATAEPSLSEASNTTPPSATPDSATAPKSEEATSVEQTSGPEADAKTPDNSQSTEQTTEPASERPSDLKPAPSNTNQEAATTPAAAQSDTSEGTSPTVEGPSADETRRLEAADLFPTYMLLGVLLVTLAVASIVGQYLRRQPSESVNPALVRRFRQRVNAWWLMTAILSFSLAVHPVGIVVLFFLTSFWALREFITMAPTRRGDHRALFWALIVFTPLQYLLIGMERIVPSWDFYGLYSIMIPVYATIFVPARIAMAGDAKRFLERSAQITSGLLICVYALSHAPALLNLKLYTSSGERWHGSTAGLLCFFVLLTQLSEILQWTWGQVVGKRMIAQDISTSRTWEGFLGGTLSLGIAGAVLWWVTPFTIWEAACISMVIGGMGMFGGMTMSAIKRDRGVNDYGSLVLGHAGVLDRIDTLCFAAPVFYHLTRFFYTIN